MLNTYYITPWANSPLHGPYIKANGQSNGQKLKKAKTSTDKVLREESKKKFYHKFK